MCRTRRSDERSARVTVKKNQPPSILTRRYCDMVGGYHFVLRMSIIICISYDYFSCGMRRFRAAVGWAKAVGAQRSAVPTGNVCSIRETVVGTGLRPLAHPTELGVGE